jgi:hypothetical protein
MIVSFDKSFNKALSKINDSILLNRIEKVILQCEKESDIQYIKI